MTKRLEVVRDGATSYNLSRMISNRQGLPCRADPTCQMNFLPASSIRFSDLSEAATRRNTHELGVHGIIWVTHEYQAAKLTQDEVKRMYFRMGTTRERRGSRTHDALDLAVPEE